jgi:dienelactone hydrolase
VNPAHIVELTPAFVTLVALFAARQLKKLRRARLKGDPNPGENRFDPSEFIRGLGESVHPALAFRARDRRDAQAWQRALRQKLAELLGGLPDRTQPLNAEILETREAGGYLRHRIAFQSRPGLSVVGYLLVPANANKPVPVVVCVPGHGRGADAIVGVDGNGREFRDRSGYQHEFALQVVGRGMAALAIEPLCFGHRRDAATRSRGASVTSCGNAARAALLLGQTLIGWRVGDLVRAIDWIETRPELDARRIGCIGISGGGNCALFAAALDTRIRATMVSGYLTTFREGMMRFEHCIDNYVPGIMNWAELPDIAGLIAPRPLFFESGERDAGFPADTCRASFKRVCGIYESFDAAEAVDLEIFPGDHAFWGEKGIPFLARHLSVPENPRPRPLDLKAFPAFNR